MSRPADQSAGGDPKPTDYPFSVEISARYSDVDTNRHVNNVAIATYYEEARSSFHRMVIGRHPGQLHGVGRILVARITIDYHEEVHYPASFTVGVGVSRIGTSSFTDSLAIFGGDTWLGACDTVHVFAGPDGPAPVPDWLRAEFETCPVRSALREV